jgi:hypothetical protein
MDLMQASRNAVAFVFCVLLGYVIASFLPEGAWFSIAYMLIAGHLFFGWLVMTKEHETGLSLPIALTILTHLAFLAFVVCLGIVSRYIPFFMWIRYLVPALAYFEVKWLLRSGNRKIKEKAASEKAARAAVAVAVSLDDYQEWLRYLAMPNRPPRMPGMTVEEEYRQWLLARAKSRIAAHPNR